MIVIRSAILLVRLKNNFLVMIILLEQAKFMLSENKIKLNMFIPHGQDVFLFIEGRHNLFNILSFINNDKFIHKVFWKLGLKKLFLYMIVFYYLKIKLKA